MDTADLSDPGTEKEDEDDQEIRFVSRRQNVEEPSPTPVRAQATTDCDILQYGENTEWGDSRSVTGYG